METGAIEKFAIEARQQLVHQVKARARKYDLIGNNIAPIGSSVVNDEILSNQEKQLRDITLARIEEVGQEQVFKEAAYTWFNRFVAIRYMEVHDFLPIRMRMFSNEQNEFAPQVLKNPLGLGLKGLSDLQVSEYIAKANDEELFKAILLAECDELSEIMPSVFSPIEDADTLLLPDKLLAPESVLFNLVEDIPVQLWENVEILGWMYQFYISQRKDEVFADFKKGIKADSVEVVAPATQLFTPDWIVKYMAENSLGRLWMENHPDSTLALQMNYYIESHEDLNIIQINSPEDITICDPACGSGHILVYAFDLLQEMYKEAGYRSKDATQLILEKNLTGFEIDKRAAQIASFALTMKAREADRRFFKRQVQADIVLLEPIEFSKEEIVNTALEDVPALVDVLAHLSECGSLLCPSTSDLVAIKDTLDAIDDTKLGADIFKEKLCQAYYYLEKLSNKFDCVIANPPYMGSKNMSAWTKKWLTKHYKDVKSDLFSSFIVRCQTLAKANGELGFMTPFVWMFIKSYEQLRTKLIEEMTITSLIQLEYSGFAGATVPICTFTLHNSCVAEFKGGYIRLSDFTGPDVQAPKALEAIQNPDCGWFYRADASKFKAIPGCPIAYWASDASLCCFSKETVSDFGFAGIGMRTGDNKRFLRKWHEVEIDNVLFNCNSVEIQIETHKRWVPYNKGGSFRKWYGNNEYIVNWFNDGYEIKENTRRMYPQLEDNLGWKISNEAYYYKPGITWSGVTSGDFSCRVYGEGYIFDSGANGLFAEEESMRLYLAGLLNSVQSNYLLRMINPTLNYGCGTIRNVPAIFDEKFNKDINTIVSENISLSKLDWDMHETSWDFERSPLIAEGQSSIADAYASYKHVVNERFNTLKANEEELNRIFIDIYGMQEELTPDVSDKDVTVAYIYDNKADIPESMDGNKYLLTKYDVIADFISYAVGCIFGRYSIDKPGLILANQGDGIEEYLKHILHPSFMPDADAILPITDEVYFEDDLIGQFVSFVETVYGKETLEENLQFIADALGGKGSSREVIRNYFVKDFYKDHCKKYQKTPIYWLLDSGKNQGFKALIYTHRYNPDTLARVRTDYVHEQQERYRTQISYINASLADLSGSQLAQANKRKKKIDSQQNELLGYEEKIHELADEMIELDLDDGVQSNYKKFEIDPGNGKVASILAKIK